MSLNATTRSRRASDGTTTGKRGRPESIVRQFWADIDVDGVGPKCIFCDHRSVTRLFRAPPATRHTLICKNAPENVKAQLRRVTNNKYSRRPPVQTESAAAAAAAAAANKALPQQHSQQTTLPQVQNAQHQGQHHHQAPHHQQAQPPQHQQQQQQTVHAQQHQQHHPQASHLPQHSQPQSHAPQQAPTAPQPNQPPPTQFAFKHTAPPDPAAAHQDAGSIPNLSSPRHISGNVVTNMTSSSPTAMATPVDASVVPPNVRSAILNDHRTVAAAAAVGASRSMALNSGLGPGVSGSGLSPGTAAVPELLYAGGTGQRLSLGTGPEELTSPSGVDRANAQLAAAVVEALFAIGSGRKKDGPVPTPAEFRAALQDMREGARSKAKRQRNEARAEVARLQNAISLLVASKNMTGGHGRQVDSVDSDDSEDELGVHVGGQVGSARRAEWANGYERPHKYEK